MALYEFPLVFGFMPHNFEPYCFTIGLLSKENSEKFELPKSICMDDEKTLKAYSMVNYLLHMNEQ